MELLVRAVRPEQVIDRAEVNRLLGGAPLDVVLPLADYHGVAGMAYEALRPALDPGNPLLRELKARYVRGVTGHMLVTHGLDQVRAALDAVGCEWAVIKGPAVVEMLYDGVPGRRAYRDLDLLVDPGGFEDAVDALGEIGAKLLDRNWKVLRRDMRGEVHLALPSGVLIDLHWNLINMYRGRMRIDSAEVIARRRHVDACGLGFRASTGRTPFSTAPCTPLSPGAIVCCGSRISSERWQFGGPTGSS